MAKKVKELLELEECCKVLRMTKDEVLYLVRTRAIPHRIEEDGRPTFTEWEILARVIPKPASEAIQPKIDVSAMSKEQIMEVFSAILQQKAAEELQAAPKKAAPTKEEPAAQPQTKPEDAVKETEKVSEEVPEEKKAGVEKEETEAGGEKTEPPKKEDKKKETKPKETPAEKPKK